MGFRSRMRHLGISLLESLLGNHLPRSEHHRPCRVCAAEQAIRTDDNSVCASHLLTHLDSLAPAPAAVPSPASYHASSPATSTKSIRRKSIARQPTFDSSYSNSTSAWACSCAETNVCATGYCWCSFDCGCACGCADDDGTPRWVTRRAKPGVCTSEPFEPFEPTPETCTEYEHPEPRLPECCSIVQSIQAALGNVRYAVSGHLAVQLQAARAWDGPADASGPSPEELASSAAAQPSIVCPRSTRDVLPSWTAASRGRYPFGFDLDFGHDEGAPAATHAEPTSLRLVVDGVLTSVDIAWVDDEQFNCAPYAVEDVPTSRSTVPVLSVASLADHAAREYVAALTAVDGTHERRVLGEQITVCLQMLQSEGVAVSEAAAPALFQAAFYCEYSSSEERRRLLHEVTGVQHHKKTIRRKPLPTGSLYKALPCVPVSM